MERGLARPHGQHAAGSQAAQSDQRQLLAHGAGHAAQRGDAGGGRHGIRLRDRPCRRHQRAGHPRRPPGAAAQGEPQARQLHLRSHQSRRRRSRGSCRARHRPFRRPADAGSRRRAARLSRAALCRRDKTVSAGREYRAAVALRLRPRQCRAGSAGRRRLAGAEGQAQEPHPRNRGRADQDRRRTSSARSAETAGAAARL